MVIGKKVLEAADLMNTQVYIYDNIYLISMILYCGKIIKTHTHTSWTDIDVKRFKAYKNKNSPDNKRLIGITFFFFFFQ